MPWYRSGTVNVTNNSTSVVGSGTNWTQAVEVGEAFYGPDSKVYEIANVVSDTQLTLATPYQGSTASGQSYVIIPSQSYIRELAAEAAALVANYGATMSTAGAGRFADGTVTAPGIRFTNDDDTGLRRTGTNALALVAGGADRLTVGTAGVSVTGNLSVSGTLTGNAATATKLQTARTINGVPFDGSANITTANWGTARTLTIGSIGKSVDGSANVSWSLAEIGAAAATHTHAISDVTGLQTALDTPIRLNPRFITADFTVPAAYNGASVGPISISDGVTVTIQDHATWSIH